MEREVNSNGSSVTVHSCWSGGGDGTCAMKIRRNGKRQVARPDNHIMDTYPSMPERYNTGILATRVPD
jgi:hypothetical protein